MCLATLSSFAQTRHRITVLPFKDRSGLAAKYNLSQKVADDIMAQLAENGTFLVVNQEDLAALQSQKNLKFDADFDPHDALKSGLGKLCDVLVTGNIEEFAATQTTTDKGNMFKKTQEADGTVTLSITAKITLIATDELVGAPTARVQKTIVLNQSSAYNSTTLTSPKFNAKVPGSTSKTGAQDTGSALETVVDEEVQAVASDLAAKIAISRAAAVAAVYVPPVIPKVAGMEGDQVVINKGSKDGITSGQRYDAFRSVKSTILDPDTHKPIVHTKKICTLVITDVDDTSAEGKCDGNPLLPTDELRTVSK